MQTNSNTSRQVNVAIVGLGFMGMTHIRAYQHVPSARIVAVCDAVRLPVNGVLGGIAGNLAGGDAIQLGPEVRAYRGLEEMLANPDVELVDLCVPTPLHVPQAVAALKAGRHVLCEKPLARNGAMAAEIRRAAEAARGTIMPAMCMRFWPGWSWLKQVVDEKTYGRVLSARFRRVSEPPGWSRDSYFKGDQSGGALLDLHIHDTDFVQFLFGRPISVYSTGITKFSGAVDHVTTQYKVACGAVVHAEGTWILNQGHGFNMAYTLIFERATVDYDLSRGAEALRLFEEGKGVTVMKCEGPDGYVGELQHIIECIQKSTPPSVVTLRDGVSAVEICEAEEKSVQTGQVVVL